MLITIGEIKCSCFFISSSLEELLKIYCICVTFSDEKIAFQLEEFADASIPFIVEYYDVDHWDAIKHGQPA